MAPTPFVFFSFLHSSKNKISRFLSFSPIFFIYLSKAPGVVGSHMIESFFFVLNISSPTFISHFLDLSLIHFILMMMVVWLT